MGNVMIPEDVATMADGPEPIGPPGAPPLAGPGGGGLPPELMAALGGGAGAPMGGPPMGPEGMPPEGPPEEGGSEVDILGEALDVLHQYLLVASDDIEKSKAMKAAMIVQDLLASNQKEQETAMGVGPAQKGMAKALAGP